MHAHVRRLLQTASLCMILIFLTNCQAVPSFSAKYSPPILPVTFVLHDDMTVSVEAEDLQVVTPIGAFAVGAELPLTAEDDCYTLIIRNRVRSVDTPDDVFCIKHGQGAYQVVLQDATALIEVGADHAVIDVTKGNISQIRLVPNTEEILHPPPQAKVPVTLQGNVAIMAGHTWWVQALAFSPDGRMLVSASSDGSIRVWRVADGALLQVFRTGDVDSLAVSPDGRLIAAAQPGVEIFSLEDFSSRGLEGVFGRVNIYFSPDGRSLIAIDDDSISVWAVDDGAQLFREDVEGIFGGGPAIRTSALSPDGHLLLTVSGNDGGGATIWSLSTGGIAKKQIVAKDQTILAGAFATDGQIVVTLSRDGNMQLWSTEDGHNIRSLVAKETGVTAGHNLAVSPDGRLIAVYVYEQKCIVFMNLDGQIVARTASGEGPIAFSSDGALLAAVAPETNNHASGDNDGWYIYLWKTP
jgi:hypothetical protein